MTVTDDSPYKFLPLGSSLEDYQRSRAEKAAMILRVLEANLDDLGDKTLLDLGCQDGTITDRLSSRFRASTGVDNDPEIIRIAREKYADGGIAFVVNEGATLPFADERFDVVVANHVLYYADDQWALLEEIRRVLTPGGACYLAVLNGFYTRLFARLPGRLRAFLVKTILKAGADLGDPKSSAQYRELLRCFSMKNITFEVLKRPQEYLSSMAGWQGVALRLTRWLPNSLLGLISRYSPTLIYLVFTVAQPTHAGGKTK